MSEEEKVNTVESVENGGDESASKPVAEGGEVGALEETLAQASIEDDSAESAPTDDGDGDSSDSDAGVPIAGASGNGDAPSEVTSGSVPSAAGGVAASTPGSQQSANVVQLLDYPSDLPKDIAELCAHMPSPILTKLASDISAEEADGIWKSSLLELLQSSAQSQISAVTKEGNWKKAYVSFANTIQIQLNFIRPALFKLFLRLPSTLHECLSLNIHIDIPALASICRSLKLFAEGEESMAKLGSCDLIFANFPDDPELKIDTDVYVRFCGDAGGMGGAPMHVTDQDVEELLDAVRYEHEKLSPRSQTTHRVCGFSLLGLCNKRMLLLKFNNSLRALVKCMPELEREDFVEQIGAQWLL